MIKRIARSGFKHSKDNDLLNIGGTILTAMTGNPHFTTPNPDLPVLEAAHADFRARLEAASRKGSPYETSLKNDSREVLTGILKQLAFYVNTTANGSLSVVLSSGFPITSQPERGYPPPTPERVKLGDWLQSGQMLLSFDPVESAWLYEYSYAGQASDNSITWPEPLVTSKSRNNLLAPVTPGVTYFVRVRARNGAGYSDWSNPVSLIAR